MFESFSEAARMVVFRARYEAGRLRFEKFETQHLVLGFLLEDQGQGGSKFVEPAIADRLREELAVHGSLAEAQPTHGDMMLSEDAQAVFAAASEKADGGTVTPLHLLWGVLCNEESSVAKAIVASGITKERIAHEI